ncbi:MAG: TIGR03792 family protein [Planctomycetota bacterium]
MKTFDFLRLIPFLGCLLVAASLAGAADRSPQTSDDPVPAIEELTFWVKADQREKFLKLDAEIWTATLAKQPGFLGKQTWLASDDPTSVKLVIRWRTMADWQAVPKDILTATDVRFIEAMGGRENFRMVSSKAYALQQESEYNAAEASVDEITNDDQPADVSETERNAEPSSRTLDANGETTIDVREIHSPDWTAKSKELVVKKDPVYHRDKRYQAINLRDFLAAKLDLEELEDGETTLVFVCSDGYEPSMPLSKVLKNDGWLAIRDLDAPEGEQWSPASYGVREVVFEPSYLVWPDAPRHNPSFQWPHGLETIRVKNKDPFREVAFPRTAPEHAAGFKAFKVNCSKCHMLNGVGGDMGPELNVPKNITEYWSPEDVKAFTLDPESFRAGSPMPAMDYLGEETVDAIVAYLQHMANEKRP